MADSVTMRSLLCSFLFTLLAGSTARAQEIDVRPYVQDRGPTSAWILWETTSGEESRVEWGPTEALGTSSTGTALTTDGAFRVHEVELTPLSPATRYYYRVHTGTASSATYHFRTPALPEAETSFRMIAVSDMQHDLANIEVWGDVIHGGILDFLSTEAPLPDDALAFVLIPGDLVDNGTRHAEWVDEFFAPAADLMAHVPFYPVLGNHERNADFYYDFFRMPEGGPNPDRYWTMDHGNVRVIGLDSNMVALGGEQEAFLEDALTTACTANEIDFVFVELHHPHHSELWPQGESIFATAAVERIDQFATDCGRPAVMFYGHTHAYSRGASRDASHLWINVATAGGNIDYFGEYREQYDDPEVQVSQDEWGFVVLDVEAGADPRFVLRRYSLGNEMMARASELRDEVVIRRYDEAPSMPMPTMPRGLVRAECEMLEASAFSDPDGDEHGASHWQVSRSCDAWSTPIVDRYQASENWYGGEDLAAGEDLTDEPLTGLSTETFYCWRVRYRDQNLAWSEWSTPVAFMIDEAGAGLAEGCSDPTALMPPPDAGGDGGTMPPPPAASCGCRSSRADVGSGALLLGLSLAAALVGRRKRSS